MKVPPLTPAQIRTWQKSSPLTEHLTRVSRTLRFLLTLPIHIIFITLETQLLKTTYYGLASWTLKTRLFQFLISRMIWALNPGVRPVMDVVSDKARSDTGSFRADRGDLRVLYVDVPPASPEWLKGDALCPEGKVIPERVPCFWEWLGEGMPEPVGIFHENDKQDDDDETQQKKRDQKVIMYFVGGAMIQGHPIQSPLPRLLLSKTHIPIFSINFRKAVSSTRAFPAALQDSIAAYTYLLSRGYSSKNICILGDSGGAGIVMTLVLYLRRHFPREKQPGSFVLISPFVDLLDDYSSSETGMQEKLKYDILNPEILSAASYMYTENRQDLKGSLLSPARDKLPEGYTFSGLPRCLIDYGEVEIFAPACERLVGILKRDGVEVEITVGKGRVHCYSYDEGHGTGSGFYGKLREFLCGEEEGGGGM